jgi:hypothetical protein
MYHGKCTYNSGNLLDIINHQEKETIIQANSRNLVNRDWRLFNFMIFTIQSIKKVINQFQILDYNCF